jgi:hypothetical protein
MLARTLIPLVLAACPAPSAPTPLGPCTQHGAKCKTAAGPLGVCDTITCADGSVGACFKCMPQH